MKGYTKTGPWGQVCFEASFEETVTLFIKTITLLEPVQLKHTFQDFKIKILRNIKKVAFEVDGHTFYILYSFSTTCTEMKHLHSATASSDIPLL